MRKHAGPVDVVINEKMPLGIDFEAESVDHHQPNGGRAEDRPRTFPDLFLRLVPDAKKIRVIPSSRFAGLADTETELFGDERRVHKVHASRLRQRKNAFQDSRLQQLHRGDDDIPRSGHRELFHLAGGEPRRKMAELLGKRYVGANLRFQRQLHGCIIDHACVCAAVQRIGDLVRDLDRHFLLRLLRRCPQVRGSNDVRVAEKRRMGGGLAFEHVERRTGNLAGFDRTQKRFFVHDPSPGAVHDAHPLLAPRQRCIVEQSLRLGGQRRVDRDEIGAAVDLLERRQLDTRLGRRIGREYRIIPHNPHPEPLSPQSHLPADFPQTDHAERLFQNFGSREFLPFPFAAEKTRICLRDVPCEGEKERDRVFRSRDRIPPRRVHHEDPLPRRRADIDVVNSRAGASDHLQKDAGCDHIRGDLRRTPDDERIVLPDNALQLAGRETRPVVDRHPVMREDVDAALFQVIADENLHGVLPCVFFVSLPRTGTAVGPGVESRSFMRATEEEMRDAPLRSVEMCGDAAQELRLAETAHGGDRDDLLAVVEPSERFAGGGKVAGHFADGKFVGLGQRDDERDAVVVEPSHHHHIEFARFMPGVDELDDERQFLAALEVLLDEFPPARTDLFGKACVPVTGKVDEVPLFVDGIVIELPGFAGLGAGTREGFTSAQFINERGLADVRTPQKGDLLQSVFGKLADVGDAENEISSEDFH